MDQTGCSVDSELEILYAAVRNMAARHLAEIVADWSNQFLETARSVDQAVAMFDSGRLSATSEIQVS